MGNKFFAKLMAMEGAVKFDGPDPLMNCLCGPFPSVNWAFATPGHGLPYGYSVILWGPPKAGKTIVANALIGQMHKDDPESIALCFNTELRGRIQANSTQNRLWGIDPDRYVVFDVNQPELVFDRVTNDVDAMCQEGAKIRALIIDSLTGIVGRRAMNADSVMVQQIGDSAATLTNGLQRILPVIRRHNIALIMTAHARAEMELAEQMRGNKIKMAGNFAMKHLAEFFCLVEPNRSKDGRVDLTGKEFLDETKTDFMDKGEKTGHKIRFKVTDSSLGVAGRTAEFTIDYHHGITNTHEEIFTLGCNTGIIERPNNQTYKYGNDQWRGIGAMLTALRDNKELAEKILKEVYAKDVEAYMNKGA